VNVSEVRATIRRRLKSGNDSSRYAASDLDDGALTVTKQYVLDTGCVKASASVSMVVDDPAVDFADIDGFRPEFIRDISVEADSNYSEAQVSDGVDIVDIAEIRARKRDFGTGTGIPSMIAFTSFTDATLWRIPKANGTLQVLYTPQATSWTAGVAQVTAVLTAAAVTSITVQNGGGLYTSAPAVTFSGGGGTGATATATLTSGVVTSFSIGAGGSGYTSAPSVYLDGVLASEITLNIPDDLIYPLMTFAAGIIPQLTEQEAIEKVFRSELWKDHVKRGKGRGTLGARLGRSGTPTSRTRASASDTWGA
jgi:hypothetical protein